MCVECGLCCDGSLFRFLPLEAAERDTCQPLGLEVVKRSGQWAMPLPCPRLVDRCCTVYEGRPTGCRAFGCHALHRYATGALTHAEVMDVVREAQRRIAALRPFWPESRALVQDATNAALEGSLAPEALAALERVHAWLDARVHWPQST